MTLFLHSSVKSYCTIDTSAQVSIMNKQFVNYNRITITTSYTSTRRALLFNDKLKTLATAFIEIEN